MSKFLKKDNNDKKKKKGFSINPNIESRDLSTIEDNTGNIYLSLNVISKRSNQIAGKQKEELHAKLNEFASSTDTLEEIHENKEQIEISKYYERMPHVTLLALEEFLANALYHRKSDRKKRDRPSFRK